MTNDICSVCLDNIKDPTILVCEHVFCGSCIKKWLQIHKSCPCCRRIICRKHDRSQYKIDVENKKFLEHLYYLLDVYHESNNADKLYQIYLKIDVCEEYQRTYGNHIRLRSLFECGL